MSTERAGRIGENIQQKTDNGRLVIEFLESMKNGEIEGSELADRVEAELLLDEYGPIIEEFIRAAQEAE